MFSVFETVGGDAAVDADEACRRSIVAVSSDGTKPFNFAGDPQRLRDGKPTPAPHRNAPLGVSKPSGLPRHS